jgi:hypothetical protein
VIKIDNILNTKVSYQKNTWSDISYEPTVKEILEVIKSDKLKLQITDLREKLNQDNNEYYDTHKKQLPAVTFSGTFNHKRTLENLKLYNSLIVLDFDKLNEDEIIEGHKHLLADEYVLTFWRSPSNKGFKGLVSLEYINVSDEFNIDILHKSAFKKLSNHFKELYNLELDKSGSDISRLCFLSYDTNLVFKENEKKFIITEDDLVFEVNKEKATKQTIKYSSNKDALYNPINKNNQLNRKLMTDIIRHLTNKNKSITYSYAEWCKVGMAIANSFTYDIGLKYFLKLSNLDKTKFNEAHCINFLSNCYETKNGNVSFGSIIYLANQKGYTTKNQKNGVGKTEG